MLDVHDLKARARRRQAAGHPERALELYHVALRESKTAHRNGADPGLCVRIADLKVDQGDSDQALDYYRTAAEGYADKGLLPNAIAVAHRIVRLYPEEVGFRRFLADLHMDVGHVEDARTHLLDYLEAMRDAGRPDEASQALEAYLARNRDPDLARRAEVLVEEARETAKNRPEPDPAEEAAEMTDASREAGDEVPDAASGPEADADPSTDPEAREGSGSSVVPWTRVDEPVSAKAGEDGEDASHEGERPAATKGADPAATADAGETGDAGVEGRSRSPSGFRLEDASPEEESGESAAASLLERLSRPFRSGETAPSAPLTPPAPKRTRQTLPPAGKGTTGASGGAESGEGGTAAVPTGTRPTSGENLDPGEAPLGEAAELEKGLEVLEDLLQVAPDDISLLRRKIMYARRLRDTASLHDTLLRLADALTEEGSRRAARIAYEQVLALEPEDAKALSGLARLDVGELEEKRDRGQGAEASGTEPRTRRITSTADERAREKLGDILWAEFEESVRQLPWLDGATQSFQAADTDFLPPVEAYEMLGRYLMAREKYEDAVEVLSLPLGISDTTDDELVDVLYYLAQAHERLDHDDRARELFDRVAEVDPDFRATWKAVPSGKG